MASLIEGCSLAHKAAPDSPIESPDAAQCAAMISEMRMETSASAGPHFERQASMADLVEWGCLTAQDLFSDILKSDKIGILGEPVISETPDAPVFIILNDTHGSPEIEWETLEWLRTEYGINRVGIEGWAGHEVDKERGIRLINAEEELIKHLLVKPEYQVTPLEDPELQVKALEYLPIRIFAQAIIFETLRNLTSRSDKETRSKYHNLFCKCIINTFFAFADQNPKYRELYQKAVREKDTKERNKMFREMIDSEEFQELMRKTEEQLGINLKDIKLKEGEDLVHYEYRVVYGIRLLMDKHYETIVKDDRSLAAVKKLWEEHRKTGKRIFVVVYGKGHLEGLTSMLGMEGDCSILPIESVPAVHDED